MEKRLVKKYVSILNTIIERETVYPSPVDTDWDHPSNSWDADNYEYQLKDTEFIAFFENWATQGILKITGGSYLPELIEVKGVTKNAYDEDGNQVETDEFILFYSKVDVEKAKQYRKNLKELLTSEELEEIKNVSKISTETIRISAGLLNQRHSGAICYENKIIDMRTGLKTLCELFIERPTQLIGRNDIIDELGVNSSRTKATIAKYVSELNRILEPYFKRHPIVNHKKEGWVFHP